LQISDIVNRISSSYNHEAEYSITS
jgi:hypothetical protein